MSFKNFFLRILLIADPHIEVPPLKYGGTERVVYLLGKELVNLGHNVDLVAGKGSKGFGSKLYVHKSPTKNYFSRVYRKIKFQIINC